ncbi:type II toxin-antitoxin system RelE/ParE family toxin [Massilia sp. TWR1-2-2]|uniref:type II toxin-antitoxin system RelE/ParE family toxin n=1 Tax=Massilia sp. TWR1-2-2 TaxID=2804584 RepID=UPI003CF4FD3C
MPQVKLARTALQDLQRLRAFLAAKNPNAARRAAKAIITAIQALGLPPLIGRPTDDMDSPFRELPITFGATGYVARYLHQSDVVTVLAIRYQEKQDHQWFPPSLNTTSPESGQKFSGRSVGEHHHRIAMVGV